MSDTVISAHLTGVQSGTAVVTVGATQKIVVKHVSISCPAGQTASISLGSDTITATDVANDVPMYLVGAYGDDLTADSSGNMSYSIVYQIKS